MITENADYTNLKSIPRTNAVSLSQLVFDDVRFGRVRIPHFQRALRWTATDNVRLFDSLLRGYPIGSLLMWKRSAPEDSVPIGGVSLPAKARPDAWFVVDGQQRLTAIAGAMLDLPGQTEKYKVFLDLESLELRSGEDPRVQGGSNHISIATLVDTAAFRRWAREGSASEEVLDKLDALAKRLLEYRVPIYVVEADDHDERLLREIFARLNSTGARMAAHEVFVALRGGGDLEAGELDFKRLDEVTLTAGFGGLSRAELLKVVLGVSGLDPTRRPENLARQDLAKLASQEEIERALELTVGFLVDEAGIPHVRLLPYPVVLPILARFFHLFSNPEPANRQRLVRWVWRGALSGIHQRAEVSKMRAAIRNLRGDETQSVERLLRQLPATALETWDLQRFNARNARSRMEMLALLACGPLKPPLGLGVGRSDEPVPVTLAGIIESSRVATEVLASTTWDRLPVTVRALARTAANRVLLHDRHAGLSVVLKKLDVERHAAVLRSHLVSPEALEALQAGDDARFLELRSAEVARTTARFVRARAGLDEPLLAPLHTYFEVDAHE